MAASPVTVDEWQASVRALVEVGRTDDALHTLYRATDDARGPADYRQLQRLLGEFPSSALDTPQAVRVSLRLLGNLRQLEDMAQEMQRHFAAGRSWPFLSVFMAWYAAEREDDDASLRYGRAALSATGLWPFERLLLLRALGRSAFRSGQSDWQSYFEQALAEASGHVRLRLLIEYGAVLSHTGDTAMTVRVLGEAQTLAKDTTSRMQVSDLLGRAYLRADDFAEAEKHLITLEKLSRRRENRGFRSHALHCLAIPRRALGEWERAEALYQEGFKVATELGDEVGQRQALRGLGHTRRLAGRALGALEVLEQAARVAYEDRTTGVSPVHVDIAAALVALPKLDAEAVEQRLAAAGRLSDEGRQRAELVRAELARRQGDPQEALKRLGQLGRQALWLREEAHAFPALFSLLPEAERPAPLPRPQVIRVRLEALGPARVTVGGRPVKVPPLAVVVLAALLLEGPQLSTDRLTEVVDDGKPRTRRQAEQRLSKVVSTLRTALGWAGSVQTGPGHYALNSTATWECDVTEALQQQQLVGEFLPGIHLPWVTETEQRLSLLGADN